MVDTDILHLQINTEVFQDWRNALEDQKTGEFQSENSTGDYTGPEGEVVIGFYRSIHVLSVDCVLITEINQEFALAKVETLGLIIFVFSMFSATLVAFLSLNLARRLIKPIVSLNSETLTITAGETGGYVTVNSIDEFGQSAESINHLLTMQKLQLKAIDQSNAETQITIEHLEELKFALDRHSIVASTDADGTIIFVNDLFEKVSGYTKSELLGQNHRLLKSGMHNEQFWKDMYDDLNNGKVWQSEVCNRAKNGKLYWVDATISPIMEAGKLIGYTSIDTDITQNKASEMAQASALSDAVLDAMTNGLLVTSEDNRIVKSNRRFAELWSLPENVSIDGTDFSAVSQIHASLKDAAYFIRAVENVVGASEAGAFEDLHLSDGRIFE